MASNENPNEIEFGLQKLYVKDISFESPATPELFQQEWQPKVNLEFATKVQALSEQNFEVVLEVTITGTNNEKPAFVIEIEQAGIFFIQGASEEILDQMHHIHCPTILFPYLRECADSLLTRGSFPPLMLSPINFEALYRERQQKG